MCWSCTTEPTESKPTFEEYADRINQSDSQAIAIVKKSIKYTGGWENYLKIHGIEYDKTLNKADSTGRIIDIVNQRHRYNQFPEFSVRMDWEEGGSSYTVVNDGNQSFKLQDGKVLKDEYHVNSAYNSSYGAHYVLFIPWKLLDPAAKLSYAGTKTLANGKEVESVEVTFNTENSTTTDHTWWYYFDKDGKPVGNFLTSPQGNSYTEYLEYETINGLLFHTKRNSYKSNDDMSEMTLRTVYENHNMNLLPSFDKSLFDIKG